MSNLNSMSHVIIFNCGFLKKECDPIVLKERNSGTFSSTLLKILETPEKLQVQPIVTVIKTMTSLP